MHLKPRLPDAETLAGHEMSDPQEMRHYAALADATDGPLGLVYRLLSRPRMHVTGAEDAVQQFIVAIEIASSADELADARTAIETFEHAGWPMFAAKLRPVLAAAEARVK